MPQASRSIVINVSPENLLKVIDDYDKYPQFLPEVKKITVANRTANSAEVTYEIEVIKRITYTLKLQSEGMTVRWSLVRGDLFKKNEGSWQLRADGPNRTHATYSLEVGIGGFIPVPKAIVDGLTEKQLPELLERFKTRAESLFPANA